MANWGLDGVRPPSPAGPPHIASTDRKPSSTLTPRSPRPLQSMRHPPSAKISGWGRGHRSKRVSATYRACAQRHTSTTSVGCRACRTLITVQRCWTEKASCGLLCTLRGTHRRACGAGWRRVCAVQRVSRTREPRSKPFPTLQRQRCGAPLRLARCAGWVSGRLTTYGSSRVGSRVG